MDGEREVARTVAGEAAAGGAGTGGSADTGASGGIGSARSALFGGEMGIGFVDGCGTGPVNVGLCGRAGGGAAPVWQAVDLSGAEDGGGHTVQFGDFSGAAMQTGSGFLPFRRPRYLIERLPCHQPGDEVGAPGGACYRVTAIGFGARPQMEVVLQSVYRKAD
ncbi:pilus assembly protein [Duganella sp. LX47W]|uniref:Pilus assembly protein n=2 Tax=Rugamonas apoptosis TaxID=2758570 RepID=A0A7W2FEL4_9BURK|nr:pilus assembly protein [Rugamonas apoptosis]